jgi:hypothetical protein
MWIEDFIFPSLEEIEKEFFTKPNRLVLVLGHPRSGTTNVQKSLCSLPNSINGTQFDLMAPSLLMKYAVTPLRRVVNWLFYRKIVEGDIRNHKIGVSEELEEMLLMIHYQCGDVFSSFVVPPLRFDQKYRRIGMTDQGWGDKY